VLRGAGELAARLDDCACAAGPDGRRRCPFAGRERLHGGGSTLLLERIVWGAVSLGARPICVRPVSAEVLAEVEAHCVLVAVEDSQAPLR
jgi:hypothetical protein